MTNKTTKLDINSSRIRNLADIHSLAWHYFPAKNATDLRAAFILIYGAIKGHWDGKITSADLDKARLKNAPEISQKTLWKARSMMNKVGILDRKDGIYWTLSSRICSNLKRLAEIHDNFRKPFPSNEEKEKHQLLLNLALAKCQK